MKEKGMSKTIKAALIVVILVVAVACAYFMLKEPEGTIRIHDQNISGEIKQDQIWSGTIHVTGDIEVEEGVTLTILPGTVVRVAAFSDDQHGGIDHPHDPPFPNDPDRIETQSTKITIGGVLNAIGTPDNMIIFTSDSENQTTYDWDGLDISHGRLEYAIVEYARYNNLQESSDVIVANNIFRNILECGIGIGHSKPISPQILYNDIYNCGHEGIDYAGGSALIKGNHFHRENAQIQPDPSRGGVGIVVYKNAYPIIEGNIFEKNSNAILFLGNSMHNEEQGENVIIRNNRIENNDVGFNIDPNYPLETIIMENNQLHDQNISGEIKWDQIWSGTIHVTGDIWIAPNITLTVLPGTTVLVAAHSDDQHSGGHEVPADGYNDNDPTRLFDYPVTHISIYGRIVARGTPDNMITFTSDSPTPGYVDWQAIGLEPGSIMEYCIVEYARNGVDASFAEDNAPISHNIVRHILWGGIGCGSASPTVTYNHIYDCGHEGVDTQPEGGRPYIAYNTIENCAGGIVINPGALPTVENNTFINNDYGIRVDRAGGIVRYNSISSPQGAPHDWTYENFAYEAQAPHGKYYCIWGIGISDASPMISNNVLFNNPMNITITGNSSPTITYNTIIDGNVGIQFHHFTSGSPEIQMNNIFGNQYYNISLAPEVGYSINAENNWWGTTNPSAIETSIRDSHDDPSLLGTLNYEPFLTEPVIISAAE